MTEPRRDSDESRLDTDETQELLTVPEAADRLGLSIDATRMRIRRGTLQTAEVAGKRFVVVPRLDTDETRRDEDETPTGHRASDAKLLDQLRSEVAYLRRTLDAEIEARRRADHLVAATLDERRELTAQLAAVTGGTSERETEHRRVTDETVEDVSVSEMRVPTASERSTLFWSTPAPASSLWRWLKQRITGSQNG